MLFSNKHALFYTRDTQLQETVPHLQGLTTQIQTTVEVRCHSQGLTGPAEAELRFILFTPYGFAAADSHIGG